MIRLTIIIALTLTAAELGRSEPRLVPREPIKKGMSPEQVRQLLGPPSRSSRIVLFRRHLEQWHYTDPPRRVDFNAVRGEAPAVVE